MAGLQARLAECHLEMHSTKTKIVYCKDGSGKGSHVNQGFNFLGYGFRPRLVKNSRRGSLFWSFTPAVSQAALTAMRKTIRKTNLRNRTQITLEDIANEINPVLRGWIEYCGRYCPSALYPMFRHVNRSLVAWAMRKCTNALLVTGHGQASSSRPSQRRPRISSRTGGKKLSARSPDGSRVRRKVLRTVLREAGGAIPPAYSPLPQDRRPGARRCLGAVRRRSERRTTPTWRPLARCSCDNEYWPTCADEYWPTLRCLTC